MNKYHVRFNTKHNGSNLVWRIFENGQEYLASDVRILGETFTECTQEHGQTKWNIACVGRIIWADTAAVIVADKD
jgi:hypothetical protein